MPATYEHAGGTFTSAARAARRAAIERGLRAGDTSSEIHRNTGADYGRIRQIAREIGVAQVFESDMKAKPPGGW